MKCLQIIIKLLSVHEKLEASFKDTNKSPHFLHTVLTKETESGKRYS